MNCNFENTDPGRNISVIIPILNDGKFIKDSVLSLISSSTDIILEVLVFDGGSSDNTVSELNTLKERYPFIHVMKNRQKTVPFALNAGIKIAKGDYIARADSHCIYPPLYLRKLRDALTNTSTDNVANVGGSIIAMPGAKTLTAEVIAALNTDKFAVGNSAFRSQATKQCFVDTVPFGFFKAEIFNQIGNFDEQMTRNQDDEFNARLIKNGYKILLFPELKIEYFARSDFWYMSKMFYQYAVFKPIGNYKTGVITSSRQLAPFIFYMFMLTAFLTLLMSETKILFSIAVLFYAFYVCVLLSRALFLMRRSKKNKLKKTFLFTIGAVCIHFSYFVGYTVGLIKLLKWCLIGNFNSNYKITR